MDSFWKNLPRPFFVLAPMFEVTDTAFRRMFVSFGRPDVFMTEFVNIDGLAHPASRDKIIRYYLPFDKSERPIVMQVWGKDPERMKQAGQLAVELGFDGIDINMGCPDKKVLEIGAGGGLIGNFNLANELILAAKEGAQNLPVSVKTRKGLNKDITEEWISNLAKSNPTAITLHARTVKEMSKVDADWSSIKRAAEVLKGSGIIFIGNGDVKSRADGIYKSKESGCDGVMVGRGVFGNYWFFSNKDYSQITAEEKLRAVVSHSKLFENNFSNIKRFHMMYKHLSSMANGFPGAKDLRHKLMSAGNSSEVSAIVEDFLAQHN